MSKLKNPTATKHAMMVQVTSMTVAITTVTMTLSAVMEQISSET